MLQLFPFARWLAIVTSLVMVTLLATTGELGWRRGALAALWLLAAGYCQFFGPSAAIAAVGLALQTLLAIYLILRWRLTA